MSLVKKIQENYSDNDLLNDFIEFKNQQSLAELFLRYKDLVFGVCLKYLKSVELSKDAVMNIYEELNKKISNHKIENFKSWLYVVTKNYCLLELRKNKSSTVVEFISDDFVQLQNFDHLDSVLEKEKKLNSLQNCLNQLGLEQKKIVELFYLKQMCYNQIVELTGIEWNKIRSLIQNGRRNLKICMEQNG